MFPTLRRRLRVLLHRYPLLPFLLAATLSVDLIATFLRDKKPGEEGYQFQTLFMGFVIAQFSMIGIWVTHRFLGLGLRLGIAVAAGALFISLARILNTNSTILGMVLLAFTSAITQFGINRLYRKANIPRFKVIELLLLSTSTSLLLYAMTQIKLEDAKTIDMVYAAFVGFLTTSLLWNTSFSNRLSIRFSTPIICYFLFGVILQVLYIVESVKQLEISSILYGAFFQTMVDSSRKFGIIAFTLIWAYGLQFRRRPIRQRKKKQQATPNESGQPVELKVVNQVDSDEPPGPIDLTV